MAQPLGKIFRCFQLRAQRRGAKHVDLLSAKHIRQPIDEGLFGANDHKVNRVLQAVIFNVGMGENVNAFDAFFAANTIAARRAGNKLNHFAAAEGFDHGVFTTARTYD